MLLTLSRDILSLIVTNLDHKSYLTLSRSCRSFYKFDQKGVYRSLNSGFGSWTNNPEAMFFMLSSTRKDPVLTIDNVLNNPTTVVSTLIRQNQFSLLKKLMDFSIVDLTIHLYPSDYMDDNSCCNIQNDDQLLFLLKEKFNFNRLIGRFTFVCLFLLQSDYINSFSTHVLLNVLSSLDLNYIPPSGRCLLFDFLELYYLMPDSYRDVLLDYLMKNTRSSITSSTGRKTIAHALHCSAIPDWFYFFHLSLSDFDTYGVLHYMETSDVNRFVRKRIMEICFPLTSGLF